MNWDEKLLQVQWAEISNYEKKLAAANKLAAVVKDGDVIGFGSGSTSYIAAHQIAKRAHDENLHICAIPTSNELKMVCVSLGVPTAEINEVCPDWCFDGADEVDPHGWLIKGRGGAMFREKLIMANAKKRYILVDNSKLVSHLCEKFPIPVECVPGALTSVKKALYDLGATSLTLRAAGKSKDGPVITEYGNYIIDAVFADVGENLEKEIKNIVGVLESGLFIGFDPEVIVG